MKQYVADRHAQYLIQAALPITTLLLLLLIWYFLSFFPRWLLWLLTLLLGGTTAITSIVLVPLWFGSISYTISATHITKRSGIFFVREQVMRTQALQYSTVLRSPASHKTGLNFIPLHAYGGTILLAFLNRKDAEEIQTFLQRTVYHQAQYHPQPPEQVL